MPKITLKDLRESLTLLLPQTRDDGEGGWEENWQRMKHLHGAIWPLTSSSKEGKPQYRVMIRSEYQLPKRFAFLWHLYRTSKRLIAIEKPTHTQNNLFVSIITKEDSRA